MKQDVNSLSTTLPAYPLTSKEIVESGNKLSGSDFVQQNWGRVQMAGGEVYSESLVERNPWYSIRSQLHPKAGILIPIGGFAFPQNKHIADGCSYVVPSVFENSVYVWQLKGRLDSLEQESSKHLHQDVALTTFLRKARQFLNDLLVANDQSPNRSSLAVSTDRELERYEGFVDKIENDHAFVTLTDEHGESLLGEYSAKELAGYGIKENRRFICRTVERKGEISISIEPVPDVPISDAELRRIDEQVNKLVADDVLDDDYEK